MKQYNRIMLGEHGKFIQECLDGNYIGASVLPTFDLSAPADMDAWKEKTMSWYLECYTDKSIGTARNSIGFLWTICYGLKIGDVVLASNGEGGYHVAEITGNYMYVAKDPHFPHRRTVHWLGVVIPRKSMSQKLQNSTGSIGTCCNVTKYADELEQLINGTVPSVVATPSAPHVPTEMYKERSLHRLLANYLLDKNVLSKTIFHESSKHSDQAQKWIHPDMVGVHFNEVQDSATLSLLKAAETKEYIDLYSFELKRTIDNDHQLKEYFFQALSNSSWANYGYLVAFEINEDIKEEMERLNRSFGIGVIKLSPYTNNTEILLQARKNELDYYTIDKLCRINPDFKSFITKTTKVLNAQNDVFEEVKGGLQQFCDKGFSSEDEIQSYCDDNHIPVI